MSVDGEVKARVREFYDSVGWTTVGEGLYQNAQYEDLRPVSQDYIRRCHLRLGRFLPASGDMLLDAGSGPIQYPEYLTYSKGFRRRVCLDISTLALQEARARIGDHGLFVVGDVAHLPFRRGAFDGVVSLHTVHHVPQEEQEQAFVELLRVLGSGGKAAIVYSWGRRSTLMRLLDRPIRRTLAWLESRQSQAEKPEAPDGEPPPAPSATFTYKHGYEWVVERLGDLPGFELRVWRSVSTAFLRAFIHPRALGRFWLQIIYLLEEMFPHMLGRLGQYPLLVFQKPAAPEEDADS